MATTEATQTALQPGEEAMSSSTAFRSTKRSTNKSLTRYTFRIQPTPPLSLKQYMRTAVGVPPGGKQWLPSGRYRPPPFNGYMSPAKKPQQKPPEPIWHVPGPYKDQRPPPLSPETRPQEVKKLPVWNPPGKFEHKPMPYFDPPSLRWSLQDLLRSMPELRPERSYSARSTSSLRKSKRVEETTQT